MNQKIEPGQTYGLLTVNARATKNKGNNAVWICECRCGQETEVRADYLKAGKIISCGCYRTKMFATNKENVARAKTLFESGFSVFQIAQKMKVSPSNVQKFLQTAGIDTAVSLAELSDYRSSDKEKWCVLYRDWGMSVTEIAIYENTTVPTVLSVLAKNDIQTRTQGSPSPRMVSEVKARVEQYKSLYEQGFTLVEIAEHFDRTWQAVGKLLVAHGCALRTPQEEAKVRRIRNKKEILEILAERGVKLSETRKASKLRALETNLSDCVN